MLMNTGQLFMGLRMRRGVTPCWVATTAILSRLALLICCPLLIGPAMRAATMPAGFSETVIPSGGTWTEAVGLAFGNTGRMYVWERGGRVWIKDAGETSASLLLDITQEVGGYNDLGLLGFALDPGFEINGYVYLLYNVDRHHLLHFETPNYNPNANEYYAATIGRLTRYTCTASNGFRSVDLASRFILVGESKTNGFPIVTDTQGAGALVFGTDGTLLASCGDSASAYTQDAGGDVIHSYAVQALASGIIQPKEDIGSFRSQLVDCLGGKIIRIDPATGNGVPSNPFYDPANPRSARSRVWALGFRNPFRMSLRPETGSHNPADGNPGVLYVGNVGHETWEPLDVVTGPGQNFGWPVYEGLSELAVFNGVDAFNRDAPNPYYPTNGCAQYFKFRDLLKEDTLDPNGQPPFVNPCDVAQRIPGFIPQFLRARPVLDWNHTSAITRAPTYGPLGEAQTINVGAPGSPVAGTQFRGNCIIGGTWYTGTNFPAQYHNTYFVADWGQGWMKSMTFDQNDQPVEVRDFVSNAGLESFASLAENPTDGSLYALTFNRSSGSIRKLSYVGNRTPVVAASADKYYGPGPLTVQFNSTGSFDPDGSPLTYAWDFGDGSSANLANPFHTFSAPVGMPTKFIVTLTATDPGGLSAQKILIISVNNTPPNVTITSPIDGTIYSTTSNTTFGLTATVSDAESSEGELAYRWQTLLHHNDHNHGSPPDTNQFTTTLTEPTRCDAITIYYYRVLLTVTDRAGLSTTREVRLYPDCGPNTPPRLSSIPDQAVNEDRTSAPIAFTVEDDETVPDILQLSASSSNPALLPEANILFGGGGSNRTLTVTPSPGQTGTTTITVTVNDGPHYVSTNFILTVNSAPPGTATFTNSTALTVSVPNSGPATPYPSYNVVTGLGGDITNVTVTLRSLTYTWSPDVDILLVSPWGQGIVLCSDAGNGPINNVTLTLSDAAVPSLPSGSGLTSGTFKPTNIGSGDAFGAPAPAGPYATNLSAFNGQSANGAWALYFFDDGANDQGSLASGWSITITTVGGSGSHAPTITDIPNQFVTANEATVTIPFAIGDADTSVTNLSVYAASSNPALVPTNNIVLGGADSNRTVTITPVPAQIGSATITVSVTDGTNTASDSFLLSVSPVNTPPVISPIVDQVINEDTTSAAIGFTIGDAEAPPDSLTLTKGSSDITLVPTSGIVFGGAGGNRTVTLTPAANQSGTVTISVGVSDGQSVATTNFLLTVIPINDPPSISGITNQVINRNTTLGPINFTVADVETAAGALGVSTTSSDALLVPTNNIVFGGGGSNRTVTITPGLNQLGTALINMSVSDGTNFTSTNFTLSVIAPLSGTASFTNAALITMSNVASSAAMPYPSSIHVTGLAGTVSNVTVTLRNLTHAWTRDIDVLLVAPNGQGVILLSDAGNGGASGISLTLADSAASSVPLTPLTTGTFRPADYSPIETFPAPAPAGPFGASLSTLNGQAPNGVWSLYVYDDGTNDLGNIAGGWTLSLTTVSDGLQSPVISAVGNQAIVEDTTTGPIGFTVADPDTAASLLLVTVSSSNPGLIPTNRIGLSGSASNRTVTLTPVANASGASTITLNVSDGSTMASTNFILTVSPVNDVPSVSNIPDQALTAGASSMPIEFFISDVETSPESLSVTVASSNPALMPSNHIVLARNGPANTLMVTPEVGQTGWSTITLTVGDGTNSITTNFVAGVSQLMMRTVVLTNASPVVIDSNKPGAPYPSVINVTGVPGTISNVVLTLRGLNHTRMPDLDLMLVGPAGAGVLACSDAGNGSVSNLTLIFSDGAASLLPVASLVSGAFRPSDYAPDDSFPMPAPFAPYGMAFGSFAGGPPNGTWSLYAMNDAPGSQGIITAGWTLSITTVSALLQWVGRDEAGHPVLRLEGLPSQQYEIGGSLNLGAWTSLGTVQPTNGAALFTDPAPTPLDWRFYRARALP